MSYTLVPLTQEYLEPAVDLFIENYKYEREHSPLLPSRVMDEPAWIQSVLQSKLAHPGVAVVEQDELLGYMVTGDNFQWKGQQTAVILEYCHSATVARKRELYELMYMQLAQEWVNRHIHLHLIRHFAHDTILQATLYRLGFGAILAERLRDCSDVEKRPDVAIRVEQDVSKFINIQREHNRYYPKAPIFLLKPIEKQEVLAELEEHVQQGDMFLAYYEQQELCGYMIIGQSTIDGEGFLLEQTNTAQIKSAYARPEVRGKGIGAALLQHAIQWSQHHGYERLFVEHETANIYGGHFWEKYFSPFLYSSMRYVDNAL